jgi:hypothetical protein
MPRSFAALVLIALAAACGPQIASSVIVKSPPQPADHDIQVFLTRVPECPYQELGTVTASEGALAGGVNTYLPAMKRRARELGGDALVGYKTANTTAGYVTVAPNVTAAVDGEIHSAVVVRFTKPDCMK